LTSIWATPYTSEHLIARICGRLIGTEFSFLDLLAYGVGIGFNLLPALLLASPCLCKTKSSKLQSGLPIPGGKHLDDGIVRRQITSGPHRLKRGGESRFKVANSSDHHLDRRLASDMVQYWHCGPDERALAESRLLFVVGRQVTQVVIE
jgi:hypothetical protein